jgi:hypothetical protein
MLSWLLAVPCAGPGHARAGHCRQLLAVHLVEALESSLLAGSATQLHPDSTHPPTHPFSSPVLPPLAADFLAKPVVGKAY